MLTGTQVTKVARHTLRVYCQARSLTLAVRIDRIDSRHWDAYSERWANNHFHELAYLDQYASQAVALVEAGAFIERMYQNTASQAPAEDRNE